MSKPVSKKAKIRASHHKEANKTWTKGKTGYERKSIERGSAWHWVKKKKKK